LPVVMENDERREFEHDMPCLGARCANTVEPELSLRALRVRRLMKSEWNEATTRPTFSRGV
jgi:hypothetical protein